MNESLPPDNNTPNRFKSWLNRAAVFAVALILTVAIILQGNFLEGLLKLLGVGASRLQTISISSEGDFFGNNQAEWIAVLDTGFNTPRFNNTAAFNYFTGQPNDPGLAAGFVMPLVISGSQDSDIVTGSGYVSPIIDLGEQPTDYKLVSIDVLEYLPEGSEIMYSYRAADSLGELADAAFQTLDLANIGAVEDFTTRQILFSTSLHRYAQFSIGFGQFDVYDRPMVAEFSISYGPEGEAVVEEESPDLLPSLSGAAGVLGDLNGDGVINGLDYDLFLKLWNEFEGDQSETPD
ncbi:MAG: hypothetical protein PHR51_01060 [Patescibacteria group bacterium]|nr:hypothetical protein [Patescibacteria group bacterium]